MFLWNYYLVFEFSLETVATALNHIEAKPDNISTSLNKWVGESGTEAAKMASTSQETIVQND